MKQSIIIVFLFLSLRLFSQGNLQFSQVKLVTTSETVPAGKGQTGISSISVGIGNAPIWLPAGSILSAGTNVLSVNVLEFNLVP